MIKTLQFACMLMVAVAFSVSSSRAAEIKIFLDTLDIKYDKAAGTIVDADPGAGDPDPIAAISITVNNVLAGPVASGTVDLLIPGVGAFADSGITVLTSAAGGFFNIDFGGGDFLNLDLGEADVVYNSSLGTVQFLFAGSLASIGGQALPFGLNMQEPVAVSFSTRVNDDLLTSGGMVDSFTASGTAEVIAVPEPSAIGLLILGGLLTSVVASRYCLG